MRSIYLMRSTRSLTKLSIIVGLLFSLTNSISGQSLDPFNPNANLPVYQAHKLPDGKILIAGNLTTIGGFSTPYIARLNSDGTRDTTAVLPLVSSIVHQIIPLPDGKFVLTGGFDVVGGVQRLRIARLNADMTVDQSFNTGLTAPVGVGRGALLPDGKIVIGISGSSTAGVFRLNTNGTIDNTFNPPETNATVISRVVYDSHSNKLYVLGNFTTVNSSTRRVLMRLNLNGSLDTSFQPVSLSGGVLFQVIPLADGKVYVAGTTVNIGGDTGRNYVARLNSDGSIDTSFASVTFGTGINGGIYGAIVLPSGKLLIAGAFPTVNGVDRMNLARLNQNGTLDTTFRNMVVGTTASSFNGPGYIDDLGDGKYFIGGSFVSVDGQTRNRIARITINDEVPTSDTEFDFDGDGKAETGVFRPSSGSWWNQNSSGPLSVTSWGIASDVIVPADYDGDGKTDHAIYRNGTWWILRSSDSSLTSTSFGVATDIPIPADHDGDGKDDLAVFRPTTGQWWILGSTNGLMSSQFGAAGDVPIRGDFDGDGKVDKTVYRPSTGIWYILKSSNGEVRQDAFGTGDDIPLAGDFNGDGTSDLAVFRPSAGQWYVARPSGVPAQNFDMTLFGTPGDTPVPADYDGDGRTDIAVYRQGVWWISQSTAGTRAVSFGNATDRPIAAAYLP